MPSHGSLRLCALLSQLSRVSIQSRVLTVSLKDVPVVAFVLLMDMIHLHTNILIGQHIGSTTLLHLCILVDMYTYTRTMLTLHYYMVRRPEGTSTSRAIIERQILALHLPLRPQKKRRSSEI